MLVLTRKANESITIGDVTVSVVRISRGQVRLAIEAPKTTTILRGEVERKVA